MGDILSYYDVVIGFCIIIISVVLWRKYYIFSKNRRSRLEKEWKLGKKTPSSYSVRHEERTVYTLLTITILFTLIIIYNRLAGNMPNVIHILIKYS